jgi:hypothetical protein
MGAKTMTNEDQTPIDLPAAVSSGWIAPASFPNKTTRGRYRTEWDGEPFHVTVRKLIDLPARMDRSHEEAEALDALRPIDYNGHVPEDEFDADGNPENDTDPDAGQYE